MMGEPEVGFSVMVTDIPNHFADEALVIGQFAVFHILSNEITKQTTEVFVSWKG